MPAIITNGNSTPQDIAQTRPFSPHLPRPNHEPSFVHALYDNNAHNPSFNQLYDYNAWHQPQVHLFPTNQYVPSPPPPPIAHQVWILDCKSCETFLTNRGMKAVLLLHPNVSLYSSDALPINCSAYSSNPDALRPPASRPRSNSSNRTCECLTQTLCCHGCGSPVGYMIVIPCNRCTSSITVTNRATNGHRFVFHSSEVIGTERHYIPNEPGVIPYETQREESTITAAPSGYPMSYIHLRQPIVSQALPYSRSTNPHSRQGDARVTNSPPSSPHEATLVRSADAKESFPLRWLKAGETLYWHHLSRHGEIPGITEDARARRGEAVASDSPREVIFDR
ncbi:hypothetical protein AX17_004512 [Amanita inopinata Kibby_2008]|nr:hypothetical protein AX17_004512 [Amanita inopinata Kibby_2008]